ncbi:MAG TPA: peptidoglycan editing factor PgeF [Steroidobacteraceae bacterium]|nr:peptidoglycan editing factor PgeF [Steroidobacteraceae bacterium]
MPLRPSPWWLTPEWPAPACVRALSTLCGGGVSKPPYASLNLGDHVGDAAVAVAENRRSLRAAAGLPAEPRWLTQVHGICVMDLDSFEASGPADAGAPSPADAAVTGQPGRVCAILTADCLPVLLAADSGARVGAAHAGWRGLAAGVIEATVSALGTSPGDLVAWLGPAIGPRHFEIGAEVREALLRGDPGAEAAFEPNARGRFMADLYTLARRRLARLGVERIYGGGACTYTEADKYFSHRRDGRTGRQATLIWIEP